MPHEPVSWTVNFPGAIQVEAAQYGYTSKNNPKSWCLHTPEEPADDNPSTPYYFHNTTANSSTHYYVSWTGFVFQMVPETEGAYANVRNKGARYSWETPANLNLQTINVEIEGYAHNITKTMPRGSTQWVSLIRLLAHRCKGLGFPIARVFGHKSVSSFRSDPGALRLDWIVYDVNLLLNTILVPEQEEEEDMAKPIYVKVKGRKEIYELIHGAHLQHIWPSSIFGDNYRKEATDLDSDHWVWKLPVSYNQVPGSLLK